MHVRKKPGCKYYYAEFWGNGRWVSKSTRCTKKPLALEVARRLYEKSLRQEHGIPMAPRLSLDELLDRYLVWLKAERSERTALRAQRAVRNVLDRLNVRSPNEVSPEKLTEFKRQRLSEAKALTCRRGQKKVSHFTLGIELRHFKAFLRRCVKQGWLARMPCDIEVPKLPTKGRAVFLSDGEVEAFLAKLPPWAWWGAYAILNTGLRIEEAMFLEWPDIDLEAGLLWVVNKPQAGFHLKDKDERSIPVSPELAAELSVRQRESGWVVPGPDGEQLTRNGFAKATAAAGKRAGLSKRVTPHVLRHTFGSHLAMAGVPLPTIQSLMGHSAIATTMVYVHLTEDHRREAVGKLRISARKPEERKVIPFGR